MRRLAALVALVTACRASDEAPRPVASADAEQVPAPAEPPPRLLYLPDGGDRAPSGARPPALPPPGHLAAPASDSCPPEMVRVAARFCIDRYEASLVRADDGRPFSPHYPPDRALTRRLLSTWRREARLVGSERARAMPVPEPPFWQLRDEVEPRATSREGVVPSGYLDRGAAELACRNAGKRLCTAAEWVTACRGERGTRFPHGDRWEPGRCNVFREAHPAAVLHDDASRGHLDPRLNQVTVGGKPLLRLTGATASCASRWGDDLIHDMVGNLDEWVDDAGGAFHGGFYSRSTREGCDARISSHPPGYRDYSLGTRCCR